MKKFSIFIVTSILFWSCSTKQYLISTNQQDLTQIQKISVVKNDISFVIPVGIYPNYKNIDDFVIKKVPAISDIETLICSELKKRNINCEIVNETLSNNDETYYIKYQDYWAWDFKKYMHVLKISILKNGSVVRSVVSQGNTAGMHDYPNPEKQVPLLIELILKR